MANAYVGFVDNSNGTSAHENFINALETMLQANGWTTLRKLNSGDATAAGRRYELIVKGVGLSGAEEIYAGFMCYQNPTADYYNVSFSAFTGYVSGNTFDTQPGVNVVSVCAHNQRIDYWVAVNKQRVAFGLKVGTPVYDVGYVGKFLPFAAPDQYPYPVVIAGTLIGRPATRYSDTARVNSVNGQGSAAAYRTVAGTWAGYVTNVNDRNVVNNLVRETNGVYGLVPLQVVVDNGSGSVETNPPSCNVYGVLDGVYWITGFNNVTENTLSIGGRSYVVIQNIFRTGFADYIALDVTP